MNDRGLQEHVTARARELDVPGVAVGVHNAGEQHIACHGVTSLTHPLPVNEHTFFQIGSTGKTYTATALMCLVESGALRLDERVRAYVPELRLQDERAAEEVTVLHLLNTRMGTVRGLAVTGAVITSAGLVLAGTFATLAAMPLVALTEIGFTVAVGVLIDTFLVRSLLVPALVLEIGDRVWWPSALARGTGRRHTRAGGEVAVEAES
jgi:CubicO group peptidase (beta-lactamase class C family)